MTTTVTTTITPAAVTASDLVKVYGGGDTAVRARQSFGEVSTSRKLMCAICSNIRPGVSTPTWM